MDRDPGAADHPRRCLRCSPAGESRQLQVEPAQGDAQHVAERGLVVCGTCGVGTNCHRMRGRNGTWHHDCHCRNHDPLRAGGEDRRCPERNIPPTSSMHSSSTSFGMRCCVLTFFSLSSTRSPPVPTHDDELLAVQLARLEEATDAERRRLIDLYQAGQIDCLRCSPERRKRRRAAPNWRRSRRTLRQSDANSPRQPSAAVDP